MIKKSLDQGIRGINKLSMKLFISVIFDIYLTTFKLTGYNSKCFKENIIFNVENIYTEPSSMFTVTKFRQVRASRGAHIGRVEWGVAFNDFNFNAELQK
jgi:hypothetical protein